MSIEQIFADLSMEDLKWVIPIAAGFLIILGGVLAGLVRGMTSGVLVAFFFGALLAGSPILLDAIEQQAGAGAGEEMSEVSAAGINVAQAAAALAAVNAERITMLARVTATLRSAVGAAEPLLTPGEEADAEAAALFVQTLDDTAARLDEVISQMDTADEAVTTLRTAMDALQTELRAAAPRAQ